MQKAKKQILILCLALAVVLMAPFKALSTPINAVPDDACAVISSCCVKMLHCCCGIELKTPADLNASEALPAAPKFVAIKGGGKVVSQDLPRPPVRYTPRPTAVYMAQLPSVPSAPLYILNRALLI